MYVSHLEDENTVLSRTKGLRWSDTIP